MQYPSFVNRLTSVFGHSANVEVLFPVEDITQGLPNEDTVVCDQNGVRRMQPPEPLAGCWPSRNVQADGLREEGLPQPYTLHRGINSGRNLKRKEILRYGILPSGHDDLWASAKGCLFSPQIQQVASVATAIVFGVRSWSGQFSVTEPGYSKGRGPTPLAGSNQFPQNSPLL